MESRGQRARRLPRELILERRYPARAAAERLGVHESRVSRRLGEERPQTRSRLETPEALEATERPLGGEGEELFRRWVLARLASEVTREARGVSVEEAQEAALRLPPRRLEAYRRGPREARLRGASSPPDEGGGAS